MMKMKRVKLLSIHDIGAMPTLPYPIVKLRPEPALPAKQRTNYRHTLHIGACQLTYAVVAITLGYLANYYLAAQPVYRIVAFVVLGILWSNAASSTARKKSVDMLETVSVRAIRLKGKKRMSSPVLTRDTAACLQAVKASLIER